MATQALTPQRTLSDESHVDLPDGRKLGYTTFGADDGPLVVVLDGPASRGLAQAAGPAARALGIRLVAPDRPGVRGSTPAPGRGIADWPEDHAALLDALGAERAGILSQSGGTPYAIAAAATLPERVIALASVGPVAQFDERASVRELGGELRMGVRLARRAPWALRALLGQFSRAAAKDPEKTARKVAKDLPPADARVLEDPAMWAIHATATAEILAQPRAIAHEIGLMSRPWGRRPRGRARAGELLERLGRHAPSDVAGPPPRLTHPRRPSGARRARRRRVRSGLDLRRRAALRDERLTAPPRRRFPPRVSDKGPRLSKCECLGAGSWMPEGARERRRAPARRASRVASGAARR